MPSLTIDGQTIEVAAGTNLIEAARQISVEVPHYCYHPKLSIAASCRMCQVELHEDGKPPRVVVACQTVAADGMNVSTTGEDCKKAREANMEFLLANHPLDCPICDKAGECDLQDYSFLHGAAQGRFTEKKRELVKKELIGNHILLDQERCILCTRCVRFMDEYAKAPQLIVAGRGDRNVIATFPGQPMNSNYEGNLADICPVGALTLKEFRFKSRVWDLTTDESVCPLCDRGCAVELDTKRNKLLRVRPRVIPETGHYFICDVGRFDLLEKCNPSHRVQDPRGKVATPSTRPAAALHANLSDYQGATIVVLAERLLGEEIMLARKAMEPLVRDGGLVYVPAAPGTGDGILYTGTRSANDTALERLGIRALSMEELQALLKEEATTCALFFDLEQAKTVSARDHVSFLALMDVWNDEEAAADPDRAPLACDLFIPGSLFSEKQGTTINGSGVIQRLTRAQRTPVGSFAESTVLSELAAAHSLEPFPAPDLTSALFTELGLEPRTLFQIPDAGLKIGENKETPVA